MRTTEFDSDYSFILFPTVQLQAKKTFSHEAYSPLNRHLPHTDIGKGTDAIHILRKKSWKTIVLIKRYIKTIFKTSFTNFGKST
jgi:hypothetical protein